MVSMNTRDAHLTLPEQIQQRFATFDDLLFLPVVHEEALAPVWQDERSVSKPIFLGILDVGYFRLLGVLELWRHVLPDDRLLHLD